MRSAEGVVLVVEVTTRRRRGGGWQQVKPLQLDGGVPPLGQRRQKETPLSLKLFLALRGLLTHVVVVYLFD